MTESRLARASWWFARKMSDVRWATGGYHGNHFAARLAGDLEWLAMGVWSRETFGFNTCDNPLHIHLFDHGDTLAYDLVKIVRLEAHL